MPRSKANQITIRLMLLCVGLGLGIFYMVNHSPEVATTWAFKILCGSAFIASLIGIAVLQFSRECTSCEYIFTTQEIDKREISSKMGYRTITREERSNQTEEKKEWEEQIRVKTVEYAHTYKCSNCGHAWEGKSTRQYQDFDE